MPHVRPSDGPVAVTGAAGFVGSRVVAALVEHGFDVRACVTDPSNPEKTRHLLALNECGAEGSVQLHEANLLTAGSYDAAIDECSAVLHLGTPMAQGGLNKPRQVYDGAIQGTQNVLGSVRRAGSVQRFVYTSSFAAISHPAAPGHLFTEADWASDMNWEAVPDEWIDLLRSVIPEWDEGAIDTDDTLAYAMAKVATEKLVFQAAQEAGTFDAMSVCPLVVLGPLLSRPHEHVGSWQWYLGRMLAGKPCGRGWQHLWNIVDVRDVGEAQARIVESPACSTGDRYQLSATDASGELDAEELHEHLQRLFPEYEVGGPPTGYYELVEEHGSIYDVPRARCEKARQDLGLTTHGIDDTLFETGKTMIDLGLVEPKVRNA